MVYLFIYLFIYLFLPFLVPSLREHQLFSAPITRLILNYTEFYNKSFPIKFCRGKNLKTLHNPWLTTGILKSIKTKSRLYKLFLRKPSHERESNYKSFRNKLTCLVRIARKNYYDNKLDKARSNLKQTWKILNEVINRRVAKSPYPASFTKNELEISNPTDINSVITSPI